NTNLFPDPASQIADYHSQGIHVVGIRKPRMGNSRTLAMIRKKHWNLPGLTDREKFESRDLNFANPEFRQWYIARLAPLLAAGIDGWWNDEGEAAYTMYYYWNLTEKEALARFRPGARLWTLNRAFSPGLQRLGAAAWTGDIKSSWSTLAATPASLLNWSLAGMPYETCDIGGFIGNPSPELLSRWMEAGVFFPVMRSHSELHAVPRFPWLFGPKALKAIRTALDLRYRLVPYYYSLAHETFETGVPIMRPLLMEYPADPRAADLTDEWLMGPSLLAAPVLQPGDTRAVYLPAGKWHAFKSIVPIQGGQTIQVTAGLDEIPVYIPAGTILPLGPVIEHTSQMPGGPLELEIYPGHDATFTLVEDDGQTTDYLDGQMRRVTFKWNDADRKLTWTTAGDYDGGDIYQSVHVVVFDPAGKKEARSGLGASGALTPVH
ncbi:MAG: TIM-barrel domain-containing protein, partial [Limisphaerales bacterium]